MDNDVSLEFIEKAIRDLNDFFGIKEPIKGKDIFAELRKGRLQEATELIAAQLGLPVTVHITQVPNDYRSQSAESQFRSSHLANIHKYGSGSDGITAQVDIPGSLPHYGTSALNGYPINIKISENCVANSYVFVMIMAHELSHILLHSLSHSMRDNEYYTDLTAYMLGFQEVFLNGRKITKSTSTYDAFSTTTTTRTTTYGYLSDVQFEHASRMITSTLEQYREKRNGLSLAVQEHFQQLRQYRNALFTFQTFLGRLAKKTDIKINADDGKRIVPFFQPEWAGKMNSSFDMATDKDLKAQKFIQELSHFTKKKLVKFLVISTNYPDHLPI